MRAYPLEVLHQARVVNDLVGDQPVVLLADPKSGAVRAFDRPSAGLSFGWDSGRLVDDQGRNWQVSDQQLVPSGFEGEALGRRPGHFAYWFGWYAFFPRTEVYQGPTTEAPEP